MSDQVYANIGSLLFACCFIKTCCRGFAAQSFSVVGTDENDILEVQKSYTHLSGRKSEVFFQR